MGQVARSHLQASGIASSLNALPLFETNPVPIRTLLEDIDRGRIAIPEFQRDFRWEPARIASLLASILARFPAGSLLFWRPLSDDLLDNRSVEGASDPPEAPDRLVLDGQQRLTALFRSLKGKPDESYFLALDELLDTETWEVLSTEAINWDLIVEARELSTREKRALKKDEPEEPEHRVLEWQVQNLRYPIGPGLSFDDFSRRIEDELVPNNRRDSARDALRHVRDEILSEFRNYQFPVVTLTEDASLAAVCTVFEKLNTQALQLGPFEILTAKFHPSGVRLRQLWETAKEDHSVLRDPAETNDQGGFAIDPYLVLQAIAVIKHGSPQRATVLTSLTADDVENHWDEVILALKRVIEWLRDSCGVIHRGILPYQGILVPLVGGWLARDSLSGPAKAAALHKLGRYFWSSVFTTNFDQGAASQAETDFHALTKWVNGDDASIPEAIDVLPISAEVLINATKSKKALHHGLMALTVRAGAKDFFTGEPLTPQKYVDRRIDSHHLFPKGRLQHKDSEERIDPDGLSPELILNRALIDAETNRRIGSKRPSTYVSDIFDEVDAAEIFSSHLVESEVLASDAYADFIQSRLNGVVEMIEEATGKAVVPLPEPVES